MLFVNWLFFGISSNEILKKDFGLSLASKGVHVLDPFTGTGTFIARMMQDEKLLPNDAIYEKYLKDLHAFEIVPLAYYVAAMNIESVMQQRDPSKFEAEHYEANNVVLLTDTFASPAKQLSLLPESELAINNEHRAAVDKLDLTVIIGNPPYSAGQRNQNDGNQNEKYEEIDARIAETYVAKATGANLKSKLYDSYIRAFRWASDRIGEKGIVAFVTNAGWVEAESANGMRRCLCEEFNDIYIYHLKGNQRTSGERSRQEGGKIFGEGSRSPIAITILVKNPNKTEFGTIHFSSVADYLSREDKLKDLVVKEHVLNTDATIITPDEHGDWLNHRRQDYAKFISTNGKENNAGIFINYSLGVVTSRDSWSFNSSNKTIIDSFNRCISFYNSEANRAIIEGELFAPNRDPSLIKWERTQLNHVKKGISYPDFNDGRLFKAAYRPFFEQNLYFDPKWCSCVSQLPKLFPNSSSKNILIGITGNALNVFQH